MKTNREIYGQPKFSLLNAEGQVMGWIFADDEAQALEKAQRNAGGADKLAAAFGEVSFKEV